jgi:hypothetical protein
MSAYHIRVGDEHSEAIAYTDIYRLLVLTNSYCRLTKKKGQTQC